MRVPKFGFNSAKARTTLRLLFEIAKVDGDVVDMQTWRGRTWFKVRRTAKVILSGSIDRPLTLKGIKATKGARAAMKQLAAR